MTAAAITGRDHRGLGSGALAVRERDEMIGRTLITGTAALLMAASLLIAPATSEAKSCSVLCKNAIKECKSTVCAGITKKSAKRTCFKTTCRRALLDLCKPMPKPRTACSPSGAFLE